MTFHLLLVLKASSCLTSSGLSSITSAILLDEQEITFNDLVGQYGKYLTNACNCVMINKVNIPLIYLLVYQRISQ